MRRSYLVLGILLFSLIVESCSFTERDPKPVPTESKSLLLYSGPFFGLRSFTITGIVFMEDRLFAGSERGLFEIIDGKIATRFNWMPEWDVIENPFYDRVNKSLWFEHTGFNKFIRFDGENWAFISLPNEERSRGDALAGFTMFNSHDSLYAYSPQGIWRWDKLSGWQKQLINGLNCAGERPGELKQCFIMAGAAGDDLVAVIRHNASQMSILLPVAPNDTQYDQICLLNKGVCIDIPNPDGHTFFIKNIASGDSKAYIQTYSNELFSVTANGIDRLPSPGKIDQILQTSNQTLLVSLDNGDILEFNGKWDRRQTGIGMQESTEKSAYLAEWNGKIAYAISAFEGTVPGNCSIRGQSALWILQSNQSQCVGL